jgi:hypothetical protein
LSKFPPLWGFLVCYHFDTVSYTAAYNTENKSSSSYVRERGRKTIPQAPSVPKKKGGNRIECQQQQQQQQENENSIELDK